MSATRTYDITIQIGDAQIDYEVNAEDANAAEQIALERACSDMEVIENVEYTGRPW